MRSVKHRVERTTGGSHACVAQDGAADPRHASRDGPSPCRAAPNTVALGAPMVPLFPGDRRRRSLGSGGFWGAERKFWQMKGVYSTAVGYAGGFTPHP